MSRIEMETLIGQVQRVLADPNAAIAPTGNEALDYSLADLSRRQREGRPLDTPHLGFWEAPPVAVRDRHP